MTNKVECPIDGHLCDLEDCTLPTPDPGCEPRLRQLAEEVTGATDADPSTKTDKALEFIVILPGIAEKFRIPLLKLSAYFFGIINAVKGPDDHQT